jgi:hypothetical protein
LDDETMAERLSIEEAFGDPKDPRSRTPAHDLTEMLVVALCAILPGAATSSQRAVEGGKVNCLLNLVAARLPAGTVR